MTMSEDEEEEAAEKVDFFLILLTTNGIIHQTVKKASHHIKRKKTTKLVHLYYIKNETDLGCVCLCVDDKRNGFGFYFPPCFSLGISYLIS